MFRESFGVETPAKQSRHPIEIHAVGEIHAGVARDIRRKGVKKETDVGKKLISVEFSYRHRMTVF